MSEIVISPIVDAALAVLQQDDRERVVATIQRLQTNGVLDHATVVDAEHRLYALRATDDLFVLVHVQADDTIEIRAVLNAEVGRRHFQTTPR